MYYEEAKKYGGNSDIFKKRWFKKNIMNKKEYRNDEKQ